MREIGGNRVLNEGKKVIKLYKWMGKGKNRV